MVIVYMNPNGKIVSLMFINWNQKWYFVSKIVLVSRIFEITRKICSNSEWSEQFLKQSAFLKLFMEVELEKTSLKIFKHYKLKPSFSIIKDEKAKNKVRVVDKPPPPSFNNLIKFDPI